MGRNRYDMHSTSLNGPQCVVGLGLGIRVTFRNRLFLEVKSHTKTMLIQDRLHSAFDHISYSVILYVCTCILCIET